MTFDLDRECTAATNRLHRSIGQRARYAKAGIAARNVRNMNWAASYPPSPFIEMVNDYFKKHSDQIRADLLKSNALYAALVKDRDQC